MSRARWWCVRRVGVWAGVVCVVAVVVVVGGWGVGSVVVVVVAAVGQGGVAMVRL
jgi:hypothetical protein